MPNKLTAANTKALRDGEFYLALRYGPRQFAGCDYGDPMNYVHRTKGDVILSSYTGEALAEIGTFIVIQVDAEGALAQGVPIYDVFDQYQETFSFYEDLMDGPLPWSYPDRVLKAVDCEDEVVQLGMLILSRLVIQPQYRGKQYGLRALKCLIQRFRMGAGLIVMKPFPLQYEGEPTKEELLASGLDGFKGSARTCTAKLRAYYARLGFKRIPRTDFMALPTIYKLDNALEDDD